MVYLSAHDDPPAVHKWTAERGPEWFRPAANETLDDWRDRAASIYRQQRRLERRELPRPRWREFARACDWFVDVQVLQRSPMQVARSAGCDRAAVERRVSRVATLLQIARSRRRRGRPRKKLIDV
jgi:hypothetical protein